MGALPPPQSGSPPNRKTRVLKIFMGLLPFFPIGFFFAIFLSTCFPSSSFLFSFTHGWEFVRKEALQGGRGGVSHGGTDGSRVSGAKSGQANRTSSYARAKRLLFGRRRNSPICTAINSPIEIKDARLQTVYQTYVDFCADLQRR